MGTRRCPPTRRVRALGPWGWRPSLPQLLVHLERWAPFPHPRDEEDMPLHYGLSGPGVELGVPGPPALRQSRWAAVTADHFTPGARGPAALLRALWFCQLLERTASPQEGRSDLASTVTQHRGCLSSWKSCLRDLRATV